MARVSFGRRFTDLAEEEPDRPSLSFLERRVTRRELEALANRLARAFAERGVGQDDFVTIALPNGVGFIAACIACWKLGAIPQPVSSRLPARERDGWESLGDMGYLDEEGYLYLVERRDDMVLCGGANVYPAEVEAALDEHPQVVSSAVSESRTRISASGYTRSCRSVAR